MPDLGEVKAQTFIRVVKKADETVNNSITFQDDDELFFKVKANKTYGFLMFFLLNSSAVADLKYKFTLPTGATGKRIGTVLRADVVVDTRDLTTENTLSGNGVDDINTTIGRIIVGGTAGTAQFQWAQNTLEVSDTKVLQGSTLVVWEEI